MLVSKGIKGLSLAVAVAWLAGCSSTGTVSEDSSGVSNNGGNGSGVSASGVQSGSGVSGTGLNTPVDVANLRSVFYFDFDQASLRQDIISDLEAHAQYLTTNPSVRIRLEGHADERGTREYNMALGERRAQAVERFLSVNGVSPMQIETISYGEEKPTMFGSDEASLSQNRRVELKYSNR